MKMIMLKLLSLVWRMVRNSFSLPRVKETKYRARMMRSRNNGKNILKRAGKEARYAWEKIEEKLSQGLCRDLNSWKSLEICLPFSRPGIGLEKWWKVWSCYLFLLKPELVLNWWLKVFPEVKSYLIAYVVKTFNRRMRSFRSLYVRIKLRLLHVCNASLEKLGFCACGGFCGSFIWY